MLARLCVVLALLAPGSSAVGAADPRKPADLTFADVLQSLAAARKAGRPADFAGRSLRDVDLSGLDLAGANFRDANLFGAKLADANLTGADLSGANLDLAWLIHADFTRADLSGASLIAPVVAEGLDPRPGEIPVFAGAKAQRGPASRPASPGGNLAGADFTGADLSVHQGDKQFRTAARGTGRCQAARRQLHQGQAGARRPQLRRPARRTICPAPT